MSRKSFIDSVRVGSPCHEKWEEMSGNDRVRFCSHCAKSVNNLSEMTRKEATRFVRASDGDVCIRYIVDPVTRQPVFGSRLLQITRSRTLAAGALSASLAASTAAYAQTADKTSVFVAQGASQAKDRSATRSTDGAGTRAITGTVTDQNGAVIPGAEVKLIDVRGGSTHSATSNEDGVYRIGELAPGTYQLTITSGGFLPNERELTVGERSDANGDTQLGIGINEVVEVRADVELSAGAVSGGVMVAIEYTSPLSRAIADDNIDEVRDLLAKGEKVNAREESYSKITPLFVAVEHGDIKVVKLLLDAGAKVNARSESKETPIMRLDEDASRELVELLVRYGAKLSVADEDGNTPLIRAARTSTPEVVKALIDGGADANAANKDGKTPLIEAADANETDIVKVLISAGAWVNARDNDGETAWTYATEREIEDLLLSAGITLTPEQQAKYVAELQKPQTEATPTPEPMPPI